MQPLEVALLTTEQMYRADGLAIAGGTPGAVLMEAAGAAVAGAVMARRGIAPVLVLCGPGNNGGDGFVAARHLQAAGWPVRLALMGGVDKLKGDAAGAAAAWSGPVEPLDRVEPRSGEVVVDALFGAGLTRALDGAAAELARKVADLGLPVIAVDVPSGLPGDGADPLEGLAFRASKTVTFFRKKPAHLLVPEREFCGDVILADIGIPAAVLAEIAPQSFENAPALWLSGYPWRSTQSHKYDAGHLLVAGGATMTGAAQLACRAGLRIGAGLVSVACDAASLPIYAISNPGVITLAAPDPADFAAALEDPRRNAVLVGPGNGVTPQTRARAEAALEAGKGAAGKQVVLDADALSVFQDDPAALWWGIRTNAAGATVLTPHDGEFRRLFPDLSGNRLERARAGAARSGAVVVLKGPDCVVAAPDGRTAITAVAPPWLATGGTGDVLAGMIGGLLAQGMAAFEAASAAVWIHGRAAAERGPGLVAEDLPAALPEVLRGLWLAVCGADQERNLFNSFR
ncbi:NAD(P)H-hydrate dehydratase [Pelagibius sp. CAU 1746]|uniref:NAD(P)H-hydrate dehydratase n=1 Tax=Pelagibius sp. CAU 1746 TaxID=3140370 RepID=UPI00325BE95E